MAASSQPERFGALPATQKRERRCCARVNVLGESQQAVFAELGPTRGLLLDVGAGGISVESVDAIEKGVGVPVSFVLPFDADLFRASCDVVWENGGRIGLKFLQLPETEQQQLGRWLDIYAKGAVANLASEAPLSRLLQEKDSYGESYNRVRAAPGFSAGELAGARRIETRTVERMVPECDLARVTEEARALTGADGAAIALRDEQGVLCRASTGSAPSIGVRLQVESGLAGECLRTGELVRCDDMDNDPRVDRAIAKRLQSRSALIFPIPATSARGTTLGVIVVLSSRRSAFCNEHVAILHDLAKRVWDTAEAPPQEEKPSTKLPQDSVPVLVSNSPVATAKTSLDSFPFDNCVTTGPPDKAILGKGNDREPALKRMTAVNVIRRFQSAPVLKRKSSLRKELPGPLLVGGLFLPLAVGLFLLGWFFVREQQTITAERTQSAPLHASETDLRPASTKTFPIQLESRNETSGGYLTPAGTATRKHTESKRSQRQGVRAPRPEVVIANGPVRPLAVVPTQHSEAEVLQFPALSRAPLPEFSSPAPGPISPPKSQIVPAQLLDRTPPVYPQLARQWYRSEKVVLKATITKNGTVANVHWINGNPVFRDSCISAIKQWRYKPASLDGQPVESDVEIVFQFDRSAR